MPVHPVAVGFAASCASPGCSCRDRRPCRPSDLTVTAGRPMVHDLRSMCDAVAYMVKSDVEWRALPVDPPPLEAACTIDSQMVKAHDTVPRATNGYQRLPTATNGYPRLPTATNGYQRLPTATNGYQRLPTATNGYQRRQLCPAAHV